MEVWPSHPGRAEGPGGLGMTGREPMRREREGRQRYRVAILGATGMVGQEFVRILVERRFPMASLRLLATERSAGKKLVVGAEAVEVEEVNAHSFEGTAPALFSAGTDPPRHYAPIAARAGAVV